MHTTKPLAHRLTIDVLLAAAGMCGIAALFLPFEHPGRPLLADAVESLDLEVWPFLLAVFVSLGSVRRLMCGPLSRPEQFTGYLAAVMGAAACAMNALIAATLCLGIAGDIGILCARRLHDLQDWLTLLLPITTLLVGTGLVIRNISVGNRRQASVITALQVPYVANFLVSLMENPSFDWPVSTYLILLTSVVYVTDIVLASTYRIAPVKEEASAQ